ncbi:MAG TPA: vanadium-dependent haloperoxidase [Ornithinibacter sp.]|nr:vanadium-dependent haloperoxidase [Ornithinibacter sp.]
MARADPGHAAQPTSAHGPRHAREWVQAVYDLTWRDDVATALGTTPPNAARCYAYVMLAMYEAVVPGDARLRSAGGQLHGLGVVPTPRGRIDWPVAMAESAHATTFVVHGAMSPQRLALITALRDAHIAERLAAGVSEQTVRRSQAHGRAVSAVVAARVAGDGFAATVGLPYVPPTGEGLWVSTPPNYRPAIEPYWSRIQPFVMADAGEVHPVAHIPFSTEVGSPFWQQANTTYQQSFANTDEQRAVARFWTDNPINSGLPSGHWLLAVSQFAEQQQLDLGLTAEALMRTAVALHDAFLSCWNHKYEHHLLRPITYVNRYIDPTWATFINTPQFPEYPSGHSVSSNAAATVLTALVGNVAYVDDSHRDRGMPSRQFASFQDAADEAARSRIYGGIHFPMGVQGGIAHGAAVGRLVVERLNTRR